MKQSTQFRNYKVKAILKHEDDSYPLIKRLWQDYVKTHYKLLLVAICAMVLVAGLQGLQAYLIKPAIDDGILGQNYEKILGLCILIIAVGFTKGTMDYVRSRMMAKIGANLTAHLQSDMMQSAIHADLPQIHGKGSSLFVAKFISDSQHVRDGTIKSIIGLFKDSLTVIFLLMVMFYQSWQLSLSIILVFPLSVLPIYLIGRKLRKISHNTQDNVGNMTGLLDDFFKTLRIIKAYTAEKLAIRQAKASFDRNAFLQFRAGEVRARTAPILETFGSTAVAVVILVGSIRVSGGHNTTGEIMSFITALLMAYQPVRSLSSLNASLQQGLAAAKRCFEVTDMKPHVIDHLLVKQDDDKTHIHLKKHDIGFHNVSFHYGEDIPAITDLSFHIKEGQKCAVVGPSGAGKSTLMNLILRLYDPIQGYITIDGHDIKDLSLSALRQNTALVAQEAGILDDSVANNIALNDISKQQIDGDTQKVIDQERLVNAAKAAEAHEFIMQLNEGYDTKLGEMGHRLSGGQRQRLAIARAIYKDAPILLLDEATSALDSETEKAVGRALNSLMIGRTTLVIAHRLSTVRDADHILVLDKGQLVESGNHDALIGKKGLYYQLYQHQFEL